MITKFVSSPDLAKMLFFAKKIISVFTQPFRYSSDFWSKQSVLRMRFMKNLNTYCSEVLEKLKNKDPWEKEFIQAVHEVFLSIGLVVEKVANAMIDKGNT